MKTDHLTDSQIQQYVVEPEMTSEFLKIHIQSCSTCQTRAENYQILFDGIHEQAKPQFDFDLTNFVLEQLPEPKPAFPWLGSLIAVFSILLIVFSTIFFLPMMELLIKSVPMLLIMIALTASIVVIILQTLEMVKNHQKQINKILNA